MGIGFSDSLKFYDKAYLADTLYLSQNIPFIHLFAVLPFLLVFLAFRSKTIKKSTQFFNFIAIVSIAWCCGFASWLLLRFHGYDAIQFFSIPCGILLILTCFSLIVSATKNKLIALSLLFVAGSFGAAQAYYHNLNRNHNVKYSPEYCSDVFSINETLGNPNKAFILGKAAYIEESDFVPYFKRAAWFLALDDKPDVLVSIGTEHLPPSMEEWNLFKRTQWETSVFGIYSNKVMTYNPKATWIDCQREFIKTHDIEMVFLGNGAIKPDWLAEMEDYSIIDTESGETCVILKLFNIAP
jgi:hypothetical protein